MKWFKIGFLNNAGGKGKGSLKQFALVQCEESVLYILNHGLDFTCFREHKQVVFGKFKPFEKKGREGFSDRYYGYTHCNRSFLDFEKKIRESEFRIKNEYRVGVKAF